MDAISIDTFRQTPYIYQFHATGQVYHAWYEFDLGAEANQYIEMRQAGSKIIHVLDYVLKSQATDITLALYRDVSFDSGSVRMNWNSYNHRIDKSPTLELYQDPTNVNLTGGIETFKTKGFGPAQGGQVTFSDVASSTFLEEIYNDESTYLMEVTNNNGSTRNFFLHVVWYESGN